MRRIWLKPWVIIILVGLIALFFFISYRMAGAIKFAALNQAHMEGVGAVNQAVLNTVAKDVKYERLVIVRQDSEGQVVLVQPNPVEISRIIALTQLAVRNELLKLENKDVRIALGQAAGSPLLASAGPHLSVHVVPVGSVNVKMKDSFISAGINQTRHLIRLEIVTDLKIIAPFYSDNVRVTTDMPLVETIIVGRIPATYLQMGKGIKIIDKQP